MIRDEALKLRQPSDGDLSASAALTALDLKGTPLRGMAVQIIIPAVDDSATDTLKVDVLEGSVSTATSIGTKTFTGTGEFIVPFVTNNRYIMVDLTVGGASPNFGAVVVDIVETPGWMWDRSTSHFDETTPSDS